MKNILVLMSVEERHRKRLEAAGESCRFIYRRSVLTDIRE